MSLHFDATPNSDGNGVTTFYATSRGQKLAQELQLACNRHIGELKSRGLQNTAVLCEFGFLANPHDRRLLMQESFRNRPGRSLTRGILNYRRDYLSSTPLRVQTASNDFYPWHRREDLLHIAFQHDQKFT